MSARLYDYQAVPPMTQSAAVEPRIASEEGRASESKKFYQDLCILQAFSENVIPDLAYWDSISFQQLPLIFEHVLV